VRGSEINQENQFIDFRLITRSGKNHAFIPLRQQPHGMFSHAVFLIIYSPTCTDNILSEPDTIPSVGVDMTSLPSQLPSTYNKGKKCSGDGFERCPSSLSRACVNGCGNSPLRKCSITNCSNERAHG